MTVTPHPDTVHDTPAGQRAARPLENIANRVAPPASVTDSGADFRVERWRARGALWTESTLKRVRTCGRVAVTSDGSVQVRARGGAVGYAGLATCGSVWVCPCCNAKIQAVRRLEVGVAVAASAGAAFGAYTLRHRKGQDLDGLWRSLSKCWQAVTRDKSVRRVRATMGYIGTIRAAEVTHGDHGWHPHLHPVHLFERAVSEAQVFMLHAVELRAWIAAAERLGLQAPVEDAQHLHAVTGPQAAAQLGEYFTKATYSVPAESVGWEMTSTQTKARSRGKGQTPWDILRDVYESGDADALDLWHHWEKASKAKRAITWSRGLRKLVGLDVEETDEEIAETELGTAADAGFVITDWRPIARRPALGGMLLGVIGGGKDWRAGRAFCDEHGIPTEDAR